MFIICGYPRSGTTLLAATLDQHDLIVVPPETDFIVPMAFIFHRKVAENVGKELIARLIVSTEAFPDSLGKYLTTEDILDVVQSSPYAPNHILKNLYARLAHKVEKQLAGDKSPNDLGYMALLFDIGAIDQEIKIIHLIRDIRDVMLSLLKLGWADPKNMVEPRLWSSWNLYLHNHLKNESSQYLLIKYEEMVTKPRETFETITGFLGMRFQEKMLDAPKRAEKYQGIAHHENLKRDFMPQRIGVWKGEMSTELLWKVETEAREALEYFGYASESSVQVHTKMGDSSEEAIHRRIWQYEEECLRLKQRIWKYESECLSLRALNETLTLETLAYPKVLRSLVDAHQFEAALSFIELSLREQPEHAEWNYLAAHCLHMLKKEPQRALKHYALALEQGFDEFWVRYNRGALQAELKNLEQALTDLKRAMELKPDHQDAQQILKNLSRGR